MSDIHAEIITYEARIFLDKLFNTFNDRIKKLLVQRGVRESLYNAGYLPDFLPGDMNYNIRKNVWMVAPIPDDMKKRQVEITGPVDRKMIINALNSGADCFMADFEDSNSPTWENCLNGQINLRDAVNRTIELKTDKKYYKLNEKIAKLMVRPRGLHLLEKNYKVDGESIPASLFDLGLYLFHNARTQFDRGETPALYLPKIEHRDEARLWNDIIKFCQDKLNIPQGTVRATVLIETLPAVFQMNEILNELREHAGGLNAGRWDLIFSFIKCLGKYKRFIFPDRSQVSMDTHMMESYVKLLVQTCHKRGIHAIGGMSAHLPGNIGSVKVSEDKYREASLGCDGAWVAHPGLVETARKQFEAVLGDADNQIDLVDDIIITQNDLLTVPDGNITDTSLDSNINVCLNYLSFWLGGKGCVPINSLMEDLATAEIARVQLWQWAKHKVKVGSGFVTKDKLKKMIEDKALNKDITYSSDNFELAKELLVDMIYSNDCVSFIPNIAYKQLT